jgi:hypothetical protein
VYCGAVIELRCVIGKAYRILFFFKFKVSFLDIYIVVSEKRVQVPEAIYRIATATRALDTCHNSTVCEVLICLCTSCRLDVEDI